MVLESQLDIPYGRSPRIAAMDIRDALKAKDIDTMITHFNRLIASIPGNLHTGKESYYHSLIHMILQTSGLTIRSEEWIAGGRIDTVIEEPDTFYSIEFKFNQPAHAAIDQIRQKNYAQKYQHTGKEVIALGISVDCETKAIADYLLKAV